MSSHSNQCRKRRSLNRYTSYMVLIIEIIENETSSFEEAVEKLVWVNTMVEEYESIVNNSVWKMVARPMNKLIMGL